MDKNRGGRGRIAIVGGGPRGLAALENLYSMLARKAPSLIVHSILFEASAYPGSGPNYAPDQFSGSWLNLPERELDLAARVGFQAGGETITGFPSYKEWAGFNDEKGDGLNVDFYPSRGRLGEYLQARFQSIAEPLKSLGWLRIVNSEVCQIRQDSPGSLYRIEHGQGADEQVDEVVLAVGHQVTELDKTMQAWVQFSAENSACRLITTCYPLEDYMHDYTIDGDCRVALRGFGLSMIDVVKGLTEGRGGEFIVTDKFLRTMKYKPSGHEPAELIPFSLDGLPLAAKPLSRQLDERFKPNRQLLGHFRQQCMQLVQPGEGRDSFQGLIKAVSQVQAEVWKMVSPLVKDEYSTSQLADIAIGWLHDEQYRHTLIVDRDLPTEEAMRRFVDMACGAEPFSFDYCLGQVWRHLQKTMFQVFSHSGMALDSMRKTIDLHERMKRYAYGPPVDNVRRLLALMDEGLLGLAVTDDPDVELIANGWRFKAGEEQCVASVLIDTVLPSPVIMQVSTPLIRQLLEEGYLSPLHEQLGASTQPGALAVNPGDCSPLSRVALLGRLANGSIFGTDSIIESFGREERNWAEQLVDRWKKVEYPGRDAGPQSDHC